MHKLQTLAMGAFAIGTVVASVASSGEELSRIAAKASVGSLTCTLVKSSDPDAATKGDAATKDHVMTCGFKPAQDGAEERYTGNIQIGPGNGPSGKMVLIWSVIAPADMTLKAGFLGQNYTTRTEAGRAQVLVGAKNSDIALHLKTNTGETTNPITSLALTLSATPA